MTPGFAAAQPGLPKFRPDDRKGARGIIEAFGAAVNHPGEGTHPAKAALFQKQPDGGLRIREVDEHGALDGLKRVRENGESGGVTLGNERADVRGNAPVAAET